MKTFGRVNESSPRDWNLELDEISPTMQRSEHIWNGVSLLFIFLLIMIFIVCNNMYMG